MNETNEATPEASADASEAAVAQMLSLQARIAELEAQVVSTRDQHIRAIAEMDNVRKRAEREMSNSAKFAAERMLSDLLAISDSLDLGLKAASAPDALVKTIADGMEMTHRQFLGFLEKHHVKVLDPVGEPFNPEQHEAVAAIPSADVAPNHVVTVMQKGYRLHERLLRPAMVVVAQSQPTGEG